MATKIQNKNEKFSIICATTYLCHPLYTFYISIKYNHPIYSHDPAKNLYDMNNTIPINCLWLSCLLVPLNGIALFVCGVILRKKTNYNVLGVISYILSALSILYGIIVLLLLAAGLD